MSIEESTISSLKSGKDSLVTEDMLVYLTRTENEYNTDGVNIRDLIVAVMFAEEMGRGIIQVPSKESIPYVRRALFRYFGLPSFETERNHLTFNGTKLILVSSDEVESDSPTDTLDLTEVLEEEMFLVDVTRELEGDKFDRTLTNSVHMKHNNTPTGSSCTPKELSRK